MLEQLSDKLARRDSLTDSERKAFLRHESRVKDLLSHANAHGVELFIDAEQSRVNPVIHAISDRALEDGLHHGVTIQAYLKDTPQQMRHWLGKKQVPNVKLVRGAYIGDARERPLIHATQRETDLSYDSTFPELYRSGRVGLITLATHNKESVLHALDVIEKSRQPVTRVEHATLLGMGANLPRMPHATKYVPIPENPIDSVDYGARRATEFLSAVNGNGLTRGDVEYFMVKEELLHRAREYPLPKALAQRITRSIRDLDQRMGRAPASY
jgi:hypothetical protein